MLYKPWEDKKSFKKSYYSVFDDQKCLNSPVRKN